MEKCIVGDLKTCKDGKLCMPDGFNHALKRGVLKDVGICKECTFIQQTSFKNFTSRLFRCNHTIYRIMEADGDKVYYNHFGVQDIYRYGRLEMKSKVFEAYEYLYHFEYELLKHNVSPKLLHYRRNGKNIMIHIYEDISNEYTPLNEINVSPTIQQLKNNLNIHGTIDRYRTAQNIPLEFVEYYGDQAENLYTFTQYYHDILETWFMLNRRFFYALFDVIDVLIRLNLYYRHLKDNHVFIQVNALNRIKIQLVDFKKAEPMEPCDHIPLNIKFKHFIRRYPNPMEAKLMEDCKDHLNEVQPKHISQKKYKEAVKGNQVIVEYQTKKDYTPYSAQFLDTLIWGQDRCPFDIRVIQEMALFLQGPEQYHPPPKCKHLLKIYNYYINFLADQFKEFVYGLPL